MTPEEKKYITSFIYNIYKYSGNLKMSWADGYILAERAPLGPFFGLKYMHQHNPNTQ